MTSNEPLPGAEETRPEDDLSAGELSSTQSQSSNAQLSLLWWKHLQEWVVVGVVVALGIFLCFLSYTYVTEITKSLNVRSLHAANADKAKEEISAAKSSVEEALVTKSNREKGKISKADLDKPSLSKKPSEHQIEAPAKPSDNAPLDWHWVLFGSVLIFSPVFLVSKLATAIFKSNARNGKDYDRESDSAIEELAKEVVKGLVSFFKKGINPP